DLDTEVAAFRDRPLGDQRFPYVFLLTTTAAFTPNAFWASVTTPAGCRSRLPSGVRASQSAGWGGRAALRGSESSVSASANSLIAPL
ncbi:hypothetical protein, partial [Mycobacterium avium]|uniref:hypothetical protein n=1 Tax=Mycobacterium avium TaxID=1764 RepID=UPI0027DFC438